MNPSSIEAQLKTRLMASDDTRVDVKKLSGQKLTDFNAVHDVYTKAYDHYLEVKNMPELKDLVYDEFLKAAKNLKNFVLTDVIHSHGLFKAGDLAPLRKAGLKASWAKIKGSEIQAGDIIYDNSFNKLWFVYNVQKDIVTRVNVYDAGDGEFQTKNIVSSDIYLRLK